MYIFWSSRNLVTLPLDTPVTCARFLFSISSLLLCMTCLTFVKLMKMKSYHVVLICISGFLMRWVILSCLWSLQFSIMNVYSYPLFTLLCWAIWLFLLILYILLPLLLCWLSVMQLPFSST